MAFTCGNCKESHDRASEGRACYAGNLARCSWLVERIIEGETYVFDCGAWVVHTDRGWSCGAGHSHVHLEVQVREGWAYASDPGEARQLARVGVFPMKMDGSGPEEIAPF